MPGLAIVPPAAATPGPLAWWAPWVMGALAVATMLVAAAYVGCGVRDWLRRTL